MAGVQRELLRPRTWQVAWGIRAGKSGCGWGPATPIQFPHVASCWCRQPNYWTEPNWTMTWMLASRLECTGGWPGGWMVRWLWCWAGDWWVVYNFMGLGAVMWRWHTHKSFIATPRPGRPPPASSSSSLKALPRPWPGSGTTVLQFYGTTALQLYGLASTDFRTLIPTSTSLLPISVKPHRQHCCRCFWSTWQAPLPCHSRATATHTTTHLHPHPHPDVREKWQ